jgi:hypothetical protein
MRKPWIIAELTILQVYIFEVISFKIEALSRKKDVHKLFHISVKLFLKSISKAIPLLW